MDSFNHFATSVRSYSLPDNWEKAESLRLVSFDTSFKNQVAKVIIKQMGHAMPIPSPGHLFNDGNDFRSNSNLVYAGVDNGRLPLLFEAVDSGIGAVDIVQDSL